MKIEQTVEVVRERKYNLEKISFFCDAKKLINEFEITTKNSCINKTDYQKTLEGFTKTDEMLVTDLKPATGVYCLMLIDSLFFR